jgi:multimeric flavodoxin WrbA
LHPFRVLPHCSIDINYLDINRQLYKGILNAGPLQLLHPDGFVFVTPEYNYGPSAVLKNAIDWVYPEWNRKAAAFVSYGSASPRILALPRFCHFDCSFEACFQ